MSDVGISRLFQQTGQRIQDVAQRVTPFLPKSISSSRGVDPSGDVFTSAPIRDMLQRVFSEPPRTEREKITRLLNLLSTGSPEEKKRAAELLGGITDPPQEMIEALAGALGNNNEGVRKAVTEALNKIGYGPRETIEVLTTMLKSPDDNVRKLAQDALGLINRNT